MSLFSALSEFVRAHRPHGNLSWRTSQPTAKGYSVEITCPCGVVFERARTKSGIGDG